LRVAEKMVRVGFRADRELGFEKNP